MKKQTTILMLTILCVIISLAGMTHFFYHDLNQSDNTNSNPELSSVSEDEGTSSDIADTSENKENVPDGSSPTDSPSDDGSLSEDGQVSDKDLTPDASATPSPASGLSLEDSKTPAKRVFYTPAKFKKLYPDAKPKDIIGKIVNVKKNEKVHLRRVPSRNAYLNGRLRLNDKVSVIKISKEWIKVKQGTKTGYVYYKYIKLALK